MNYKSSYILTTFLFFIAPLLNAIDWQISWDETPSLKFSQNLTDTCSAGIKISIESLNFLTFYTVYKNYCNLTNEQKISIFTNPNLFIDTQTSFYIMNKNEQVKLKAQIIKKNDQDLHFSVGSCHSIDQECYLKHRHIIHPNRTPESNITFSYNKKITDNSNIQLHIKGFIKSDEAPYSSLNCSYDIYNILGIRENILIKNGTITPSIPTVYTPTKNSFLNNASAMTLNIAIPCAFFAGKKEREFHFPDVEQNKAYAEYIMEKLDYNKELLNDKINELKKELL